MLPYTSHDLLRVLNNEITPKEERELGPHLARDIRRTDDDEDDSNGPDRGESILSRLFIHRLNPAGRGLA